MLNLWIKPPAIRNIPLEVTPWNSMIKIEFVFETLEKVSSPVTNAFMWTTDDNATQALISVAAATAKGINPAPKNLRYRKIPL